MREKKSKLIDMTMVLLYFALSLFLMLRHELWRDEVQAWLLARDLSIPQLIRQMAYEGHPCLWHLILMPFAKLGFPVRFMNCLSLAIMTVTVYLFVKWSPFSKWINGICVFGVMFVYFYPTISRSYCLIPLFIVLLMRYEKEKSKRPILYGILLAMLVQTHIIMVGMAGMISLMWLWEEISAYWEEKNRKRLLENGSGLLLPLLSVIFLYLELRNCMVSSASGLLKEALPPVVPTFLETLKINIEMISVLPVAIWVVIAGIVIISALVVNYTRKNLWLFVCAFAAVFSQFVIYAFVYESSVQRLLSAFWIVWWAFACAEKKKTKWNYPAAVGSAVLLISATVALGTQIEDDVKRDFSDALQIVQVIEKEIPEDAYFYTLETSEASTIAGYLPDFQILDAATGQRTTYAIWDENREVVFNLTEVYEELQREHSGKEIYVLIPEASRYDDPDGLLEKWELIYQTPEPTVIEEDYSLYKI